MLAFVLGDPCSSNKRSPSSPTVAIWRKIICPMCGATGFKKQLARKEKQFGKHFDNLSVWSVPCPHRTFDFKWITLKAFPRALLLEFLKSHRWLLYTVQTAILRNCWSWRHPKNNGPWAIHICQMDNVFIQGIERVGSSGHLGWKQHSITADQTAAKREHIRTGIFTRCSSPDNFTVSPSSCSWLVLHCQPRCFLDNASLRTARVSRVAGDTGEWLPRTNFQRKELGGAASILTDAYNKKVW